MQIKKIILSAYLFLLAFSVAYSETSEPDFSAFRGAGIIDKLGPGWFPPETFRESDFAYLASIGANFVRIPITYHHFADEQDLAKLDETKMHEVDQAIEWSQKYGLHACLSIFWTPGYYVGDPWQDDNLWESSQRQAIFAGYWKTLTKRYAHVSNLDLSFNLLNEPDWYVTEEQYVFVIRQAIQAIRSSDTSRWIVIDGLRSGRLPVMSLADEARVAQAVHFYEPFAFTHYKAHWIKYGGTRLPKPSGWPAPRMTEHLFGPGRSVNKPRAASPIQINGDFQAGSLIKVHIGWLHGHSSLPLRLELRLDQQDYASGYFEFDFTQEKVCNLEAEQSSNTAITGYWYNRVWEYKLEKDTEHVNLLITSGDRISIRSIEIQHPNNGKKAICYPGSNEWIKQESELIYDADANHLKTSLFYDQAWIQDHLLKAWKQLADKEVPIMVQEFGIHNGTQYEPAMAYLKDCVEAFESLGWGWSLYSLRYTLGWFDSGRENVLQGATEDGTKVDLKYEELVTELILQKAISNSHNQ